MDKIIAVLNYIFGTNPKTRFRRIIMTLAMIMIFVMGFLNLRCGVIKTSGFYIMWSPGAEIKINR